MSKVHWITLDYTRYLHIFIVFWGVSYVSCLDKTISGASDKLSAARKSEGSRGRCTRRNKSAALRDASKPVSSIFLERVQSKWFQNGRFLWLAMTHAYTGHIWKDSREFNEFPSLCHGGIPMPTHFLCLFATIQIGTHPHRDDPWWPMMTHDDLVNQCQPGDTWRYCSFFSRLIRLIMHINASPEFALMDHHTWHPVPVCHI